MLNIMLVARWSDLENERRLYLPSRVCFGPSMVSIWHNSFTTIETEKVIGIFIKCQDAKRAGWKTTSHAAIPGFCLTIPQR